MITLMPVFLIILLLLIIIRRRRISIYLTECSSTAKGYCRQALKMNNKYQQEST
jgi:hypothetical protein